MSSENKKSLVLNKNEHTSTSEKDSWSKSEEVWQRVNAILNNGVLALVDERQCETRRYLEDVEERLTDIIKKAKIEVEQESVDLPDAAAILPSGNISQEIRNAIGAINMINDKHLKFQLTTFVDDYRRILEMNREEEQHELLEELEEHFEKGSYDFVEQKEETDEMLESMAVVEEEVRKTMDLKLEMLDQVRKMKSDNESQAIMLDTISRERVSASTTKAFKVPSMKGSILPSISEIPKTSSKEEALAVINEILQKPQVMAAIGAEDFAILVYNIGVLQHDKKERSKKDSDSAS